MPEVRALAETDVKATAQMLGRAFDDDPVATYIFSNDRSRRRALPSFFRIQMQQLFLTSHCSFVTEDRSAASLWLTTQRSNLGLRALLPLLPLGLSIGRRVPPTLRLLGAIDTHHPKAPHYYLGVIGTEPSRQGQGLGSSVMAPGLAAADGEGMPAYLESSKEANLAFYNRFGFEVTKELKVPGAPTLWLMWREPRPVTEETM